jgi:hypothetical protein
MFEQKPGAAAFSRWVKIAYILTLFFMALTGFGQMPIYNRYYMSDIPGLGWLADFYITRNIHYIGAVILLGLVIYVASDFILSKRKQVKLTASGSVRVVLLSAIVISGALVVIKNFPYVHFSDGFIIGLDLFHLAGVMAFLMTNLVCWIAKKRWAMSLIK